MLLFIKWKSISNEKNNYKLIKCIDFQTITKQQMVKQYFGWYDRLIKRIKMDIFLSHNY